MNKKQVPETKLQKLLGISPRIKLLEFFVVTKSKHSVMEVTHATEVHYESVRKHLTELIKMKLVNRTKENDSILYSASDDKRLKQFLKLIKMCEEC